MMKRKEPISNIMTKDVVTLHINDNLYEAERLFKHYHIRHIPVVKKDSIIGMLSLTDIQRLSFADSYNDSGSIDKTIFEMLSVGQIMAKKPESVSSTSMIKEAAALLASREFHALPVVDNDKLVGIVTTTDLLNYLLDQY